MPKSNKYPIDLGKTIETPSLAGSGATLPAAKGSPEKYYPSISLEWDEPYDLPESGEITFTFKRTSETNSKKPDGKSSQRVELDLTSILDAESDEEEADEETTGDRLDKAKSDLEKKAKRKSLPADEGADEVAAADSAAY